MWNHRSIGDFLVPSRALSTRRTIEGALLATVPRRLPPEEHHRRQGCSVTVHRQFPCCPPDREDLDWKLQLDAVMATERHC